jgi:hypothetical protein
MRAGISAVLMQGRDDLGTTVLDLAAVLEGLVPRAFEIILVSASPYETAATADELRARSPGLPVRVVRGETIADGCDAASFGLIFVASPDGQFDVRELNHLLDAIERGADVAAGYRPRRGDAILRRLQRWGLHVNVDCAYELIRQPAWRELARRLEADRRPSHADVMNLRRFGFDVAEVPVRHGRPALGAALADGFRAA